MKKQQMKKYFGMEVENLVFHFQNIMLKKFKI